MMVLLYVLCMLAVGADSGPEVEAAYPLSSPTDLTPASDATLASALTHRGVKEGGAKEEVEKEQEKGPYFDASMVPIETAYLGKTATLTCIVHAARSDKSVTWLRGRDLRILTVGRYTYTTDLRFQALHQEASSEWMLRIKSVQLRDQGNYECQITTRPVRTFTVFLKVVEPWVEILGAPDIYVNRASMINLTCIVHHAPYPPEAITWYHDNKSIGYTSPRGGVSMVEERAETTTSFLLLQNARPSDTGTFKCHPHGMTPATANLHVLSGEQQQAIQSSVSEVNLSFVVFIPTVLVTIALSG